MKLYVKGHSSYAGELKDFDVKKELKTVYKRDTRRQDSFIHLALYGALRLKDKCEIKSDDELYITSGVGNMDVIQKAYKLVKEQKEYFKPFDFINMLGNTTSYYVASALGVKSKNIFQISNNFTYINTLISIFASLNISKKEAIVGSVDLATDPTILIQRVLGVPKTLDVISGVNYQKLSLSEENAVASIEFDTKLYSSLEIKELIKETNIKVKISQRDDEIVNNHSDVFFETVASFYLNEAIEKKQDLLYIECYYGKYRVLKLVNLP